MRTARIKVPTTERDSVYHVMTRTVNGAFLLDDPAKETLRKQLWQIADYCGVQVLTFAIMSNHFHVLLRVPKAATVRDDELLRRYGVLYPKPTRFQQARLDVIAAWLKSGDPEGEAWRKRQLAMMGDVSQFMKLLKQRFSVWFNRTHNRYGTLWAERFKSVLVEPTGKVVETIAAYIDLNAVRACLVADPKDYRFCGYGDAFAGNVRAQAGLRAVLGGETLPDWEQAQADYRLTLFGIGSGARPGEGTGSPATPYCVAGYATSPTAPSSAPGLLSPSISPIIAPAPAAADPRRPDRSRPSPTGAATSPPSAACAKPPSERRSQLRPRDEHSPQHRRVRVGPALIHRAQHRLASRRGRHVAIQHPQQTSIDLRQLPCL